MCDRCRFNVYPDTIRELLLDRWSALVPSRTSQPPSYVDRKIMKKPTMDYTRRSLLPHDTRSNQGENPFHPMKCRSLSHTGVGLIPGSTLDRIGTAVHLYPIRTPSRGPEVSLRHTGGAISHLDLPTHFECFVVNLRTSL